LLKERLSQKRVMTPGKTKKVGGKRGRYLIRRGSSRVKVRNSGLEVWIYDDANREEIILSGAMKTLDDQDLSKLFRQGLLAAYELYQDDTIDVEVIVGEPVTEQELACAAWLEPQSTYLHLPSGRFCIESNDASRIGPEEPGVEGAQIEIEPGEYKLSLYRIDEEALNRNGICWSGPREVIVLSPGGTPADAASQLLPFKKRRTLDWVRRYSFSGDCGEVLVWFGDYWDTFVLNLDRTAAESLGLNSGSCLEIDVANPKIKLVTVFCDSWEAGHELEPPSGISLDEYGFAALCPLQEWDGEEALCCRRHLTKLGIPEEHKNLWLPAKLKVLAQRAKTRERVRGELLFDCGQRVFWRGDLSQKTYYTDLQFLTARLMGKVEGLPWGEPIALADALVRVDAAMAELGLRKQGDFTFDVSYPSGKNKEFTNRIYTGHPALFSAICGSEAVFDVFFLTKFANRTWLLTGTVPASTAEQTSLRPGLTVKAGSGRFKAIFEQHLENIDGLNLDPAAAPQDLESAVHSYEEYLSTALD
jgi:hypothetical protein